jgi:hypothetical protein
LPITFLRFSPIGDFFVATGEKVLNIWRKDDSMAGEKYSSEYFLACDNQLAIPSRYNKFVDDNQLGRIIQSEISVEGRLIATLEEDKKYIKIWYNFYIEDSLSPYQVSY